LILKELRTMALGILHHIDAGKVEKPDRVFTDIHDMADEHRSLTISVREAAFRRDAAFLRIYRVEFIRQARLLAGLIGDLAPLEGEKARAK
jgi:hypothetical protein